MNNIITLDDKKCSACGDCVSVCPQNILKIREISNAVKESMTFFQRIDALYHKNKELAVIVPEKCLECSLCIAACRHSAISLEEIKDIDDSPPKPVAVATRTPDEEKPRFRALSNHSGETIRRKLTNFPPFYFFATILLNIAFFFFLPRFNHLHIPCILAGITALAGGLYLMNKSSDLFNKKKTTFYLEEPSAFVQDGFYRRSRNPMYLGMLIFISGLAISLGNLIGLVTPLIFVLTINFLCIPPEEIIMEKTFGHAYFEYKQRVRRWI